MTGGRRALTGMTTRIAAWSGASAPTAAWLDGRAPRGKADGTLSDRAKSARFLEPRRHCSGPISCFEQFCSDRVADRQLRFRVNSPAPGSKLWGVLQGRVLAQRQGLLQMNLACL